MTRERSHCRQSVGFRTTNISLLQYSFYRHNFPYNFIRNFSTFLSYIHRSKNDRILYDFTPTNVLLCILSNIENDDVVSKKGSSTENFFLTFSYISFIHIYKISSPTVAQKREPSYLLENIFSFYCFTILFVTVCFFG